MKISLIRLSIVCLLAITSFFFYQWKNPDVNYQYTKDMRVSIYGGEHCDMHIDSFGTLYHVSYVENVSCDAINPYFPAIHIKASKGCNGWLHVVRTDCVIPELSVFIDSVKNAELYPFYNRGQLCDFYDAPLWRYRLWYRPITFWEGHAYAVHIDEHNKTVKCLGGVKWGYFLSYWKVRPIALRPSALTEKNWEEDKELFKAYF